MQFFCQISGILRIFAQFYGDNEYFSPDIPQDSPHFSTSRVGIFSQRPIKSVGWAGSFLLGACFFDRFSTGLDIFFLMFTHILTALSPTIHIKLWITWKSLQTEGKLSTYPQFPKSDTVDNFGLPQGCDEDFRNISADENSPAEWEYIFYEHSDDVTSAGRKKEDESELLNP